jgi:L,D-transpeptidase ErfK/SrfK
MYIHRVKSGETLWSISEDYRVSLSEIIILNNIINPNLIFVGQKIVIPYLPDPTTIPYTIEVNRAQKKLYLKMKNQVLNVYPIAVGRILHETPAGQFVIVNRQPNPGGVFGVMWLSLSKKHYGIHGTNNPSSIGKAVSRGCIRMYNKDVKHLSSLVSNGTTVIIK